MDIKLKAAEYSDYIVEKRRLFHSIAEPSGEEKNTAEEIKIALADMGIPFKAMEDCYGIVGEIEGGKKGKTIALRADTDALHTKENTGLPFAGKNGIMHSCGHDTHIAMLLGAAKILNQYKNELDGNVRLIFQPQEEIGKGAKLMIKAGALIGADAIFGLHIMGGLPSGKINIEGGNRMSCCDTFAITVTGVAAHGAMPHNGCDAIVASAAMVSALQTIASRRCDPVSPFVLTIGTINGGEQLNIIADKVVMTGTVRSFTTGEHIVNEMEKIIHGVAEAYGVKAELQYNFVLIPLINSDGGLLNIAQNSVKKLYGEDTLVKAESMMVSEDFAYYMEEIPGIFGFLGTYNEAKGLIYGNHSDKFTADEDILHMGSATLAQFAVDFLANNR